ncbi:hypothetical protein HDU76_001314, partial [Blyttiomyces sp. JEL0837]
MSIVGESAVRLNLRASTDFFLHCEHACEGPDGVMLRNRFQQLKEQSFRLSGVDMTNFMGSLGGYGNFYVVFGFSSSESFSGEDEIVDLYFGSEANDEDAVLTLMNVCKPKRNATLMDLNSLCDVGAWLYKLELVEDADGDLPFESLRGINTLTNLRTLRIDHDVVSNIQENAQYLVLPHLVELEIYDLDVTSFLHVLRHCPSLEKISVVRLNLRANEDFFLHCEDSLNGPDGAILR